MMFVSSVLFINNLDILDGISFETGMTMRII